MINPQRIQPPLRARSSIPVAHGSHKRAGKELGASLLSGSAQAALSVPLHCRSGHSFDETSLSSSRAVFMPPNTRHATRSCA
jgi:hypothetical protein